MISKRSPSSSLYLVNVLIRSPVFDKSASKTKSFHQRAAVPGAVVVFGEFVQDVYPGVSSLAVEIFPHHALQGPVEPLHDDGLFVGPHGEVVYVMTPTL